MTIRQKLPRFAREGAHPPPAPSPYQLFIVGPPPLPEFLYPPLELNRITYGTHTFMKEAIVQDIGVGAGGAEGAKAPPGLTKRGRIEFSAPPLL